MKTRPIFISFFSIFSILIFSQEKKDTLQHTLKYQPNFMVGINILNGGLSLFSNRKIVQGFVSSKIKKDLHAVVDLGFEKNSYQKNDYDATVSGGFIKLGGFYRLLNDPENESNGFYTGGKIASSIYTQEYFAVPVRGYSSNSTVAFPSATQTSLWIEGTIGGRIQLFESPFFVDVNIQPKYMIFSTKQDDLIPMIVPGFGKSSTKFNIGFAWNIAYQF